MKLLEFLDREKTAKLCYLYVGDCAFQKEVFLAHCMVLFEDIQSRQRLSLVQSPVEEMVALFVQPRLVNRKQLFLIEDTQVLANNQLKSLLEACSKGKNPNIKRIVFLSAKPPSFDAATETTIVYQEANQKKNLIDLTCAMMGRMGLPVDKVLAKGIVQSNFQNPLSIISELRKLNLVFDREAGTYSIKDVLPLVEHDPTQHLFGFLDRLGTRSLKKSLQEFLFISKQDFEEGPKLIGLIKSHFRKLMDLKNWTEELDELRLVKLSHRYFTSVSWREKERQVESIRNYYESTLNDDEFNRFSKVFKSDYYLCKLLYQQRAYKREELFKVLQELNTIQAKIQSSNTELETQLIKLIYTFCNRDTH